MANQEQDFAIGVTPRQPKVEETGVVDTNFPMSVKPRKVVAEPVPEFSIDVKPRAAQPEPKVPDFSIQAKPRVVQPQEDFDLHARPHTATTEADFPLVVKKRG